MYVCIYIFRRSRIRGAPNKKRSRGVTAESLKIYTQRGDGGDEGGDHNDGGGGVRVRE